MIPETTPRNTQQQQHALVEPDATQTPRSNVHDVVHIGQPFVRWSARRKRDAWFLLVVLLLGNVTIFALSNGTAILKQPARYTSPYNNEWDAHTSGQGPGAHGAVPPLSVPILQRWPDAASGGCPGKRVGWRDVC